MALSACRETETLNAISPLPIDRRAGRTHLFLVASVTCGRASVAVRVRNLSASGALIEAASLPPVGSLIALCRGELEAFGTIVWAEFGKAGLTFTDLVDVSAWLPVKEAKRQVKIDPIAVEVQQASPLLERALSMEAIVAELGAIQAQLGRLDARFSLDPVLLAKHPEAQSLQVAGQLIATIIAALQDGAA